MAIQARDLLCKSCPTPFKNNSMRNTWGNASARDGSFLFWNLPKRHVVLIPMRFGIFADKGTLEQTLEPKEKIGFVFQGINLINNLNVFENVLSPTYKTKRNRQELENEINELLKKMELSEHKYKFPNQLSGGQRQRVAICRALINHPKVIFADEPTGNLDSRNGKQILDLLFELADESKKTLVIVTHDAQIAARGDRTLIIRDGIVAG